MNQPPAAILPAEAALLIMDYQRGIVGQVGDADALRERAKRALALARANGMTVGYVRVAFTDADVSAMPSRNKMAGVLASYGPAIRDDSPLTQIDDALAPQPGDIVVRKTRVGPFSSTDLAAQLRERNVTTLVLSGVSTSGVVLSTVREGADRDYRLVVLSDACADPMADVHETLMAKVFPRQADVMTVEAFASLLPA